MKNRPDCLPCCLRRVLHMANVVTSDEWLHRKILADAMQGLGRVDDLATPAEVVFEMTSRAARTLGVADPYAEEKKTWVKETTQNADVFRDRVAQAQDPLLEALRFSMAASLADHELREELIRGFSPRSILEEIDHLPFNADNLEDFRDAVDEADSVLFVHDSAGELFFDRLLIEQMRKKPDRVLSVVRESPILADATVEEAKAVGLDEVARLIDPGVPCLGIPLSSCSKEFRAEYSAASLVVAKGQAAFETLEGKDAQIEGEEKQVFFLLRVKCPVVARQFGVSVGDCVLEPN